MSDDWRLTINLPEGGHGIDFANAIDELPVAADAAQRLGERVAVSADGPNVYLYTDTESQAREAQRLVDGLLSEHSLSDADQGLQRWHPDEERWEDASVPLPQSDAQRADEHARRIEQERAEASQTGEADWEVRARLPSHRETVAFAEVLRGEGIPVRQLWRYLLVGAASEDDARALANRLRDEAPEGTVLHVELSGDEIARITGGNPFAILGGMGG